MGYSTVLFFALGIGLAGFVLGVLATFLYWMKSEDADLKRGYIEIAGNCYRLQPILLVAVGGTGRQPSPTS